MKGPELILLELNTYYVFNNKKFSYASALSQTTWQKKSAGSVIAGASIFASYLGFDHDFFGQIQFPTPYYADTLNVLSWNLLVGVGPLASMQPQRPSILTVAKLIGSSP